MEARTTFGTFSESPSYAESANSLRGGVCTGLSTGKRGDVAGKDCPSRVPNNFIHASRGSAALLLVHLSQPDVTQLGVCQDSAELKPTNGFLRQAALPGQGLTQRAATHVRSALSRVELKNGQRYMPCIR